MPSRPDQPNDTPTPRGDALTLREVQGRVDDWISQFEEGYFPPLANLARLTEEVGELARVVSHLDGFKKPKDGEPVGSVTDELGDILFVLICLANQLDIDLNDAITGVLHKVDARDRSRWTLKDDAS